MIGSVTEIRRDLDRFTIVERVTGRGFNCYSGSDAVDIQARVIFDVADDKAWEAINVVWDGVSYDVPLDQRGNWSNTSVL